jgi:hypothetical protein
VHDWSRYRDDPLGRLSGTVRWVISTTFGSREQVDGERARVARFHTGVRGEYEAHSGRRAYSAEDADLVEWVHLAFTDAFLTAHERWGGTIPGGRDAYVADWATAGTLMGVVDPPRTAADLRARMHGLLVDGTLRGVHGSTRSCGSCATFRSTARCASGTASSSPVPSRRSRVSIGDCWVCVAPGSQRSRRRGSCCGSRSAVSGRVRGHTTSRIRLRRLDAAAPRMNRPENDAASPHG